MSGEILIVDDEADIRDLVAGILQDEGYTARTARNSDEAMGAMFRTRKLEFDDLDVHPSSSRPTANRSIA